MTNLKLFIVIFYVKSLIDLIKHNNKIGKYNNIFGKNDDC